jgi:hypothetical protein
MNAANTWLGAILLGGMAAWAPGVAYAQTWQQTPADSTTQWQQRVLKHPQQSQWHAAAKPANSFEQNDQVTQVSSQYQNQPVRTVRQASGTYQTARRSANEVDAFDVGSVPKEPTPAVRPRASASVKPEVIPPGQTQFEPMASEGSFAGPAARGGADCGEACGMPCDDCGACDPCGCPPCGETCDFGWEVFDGHCERWVRGLSIFAGVNGFKTGGPVDLPSRNGTFGINEGLNLARPLGDPFGCGYQIGANFVQSNFAGNGSVSQSDNASNTTFFDPYRKQYFITAALFRRADPCYGGFQAGVAYDYLHDVYNPYGDGDFSQSNYQQIRSETSFLFDHCWEIGYYGAYAVSTERKPTLSHPSVVLKMSPTDMYTLFVRRNFENGGDGRIWAGATGNGDGLIGADVWVPLGESFAIENRINYMIPKQGSGMTGQSRESWGMVIQLVWYPGLNAKCQKQNPYRPIFNVADNSLFMIDRMLQTK